MQMGQNVWNGGWSGVPGQNGVGSGGQFQVEAMQFGLWMQAHMQMQLQQAYWAGFQAGMQAGQSQVPGQMLGQGSGAGWPWSGMGASPIGHQPVQNFNGPVNGPLAHLFMQSGGQSAQGGSRDAA